MGLIDWYPQASCVAPVIHVSSTHMARRTGHELLSFRLLDSSSLTPKQERPNVSSFGRSHILRALGQDEWQDRFPGAPYLRRVTQTPTLTLPFLKRPTPFTLAKRVSRLGQQ
jgi:hypothetical protein